MVHRYRSCHPSNRRCRGRYNSHGTRRLNKTNKAFATCVRVLNWIASKTGLTYEHVNVWFFCVIWPVATIGLVVANVLKK